MVVGALDHRGRTGNLTMRAVWAGIVVSLVAACEPTIPESGVGVGFSDYDSYQGTQAAEAAAAEAATTSAQAAIAPETPDVPVISPETPASGAIISAQELSAAGLPASTGTTPDTGDHSGISDEQDFGAVSGRESIESDRERLAANADAYTLVEPTDLPSRDGAETPNIVAYALSSDNPVGEKVYSRFALNAANRFARNCAKYASSDLAQIDFLANGGPSNDRFGLDPDGDGFACFWDPTPFRQAAQN